MIWRHVGRAPSLPRAWPADRRPRLACSCRHRNRRWRANPDRLARGLDPAPVDATIPPSATAAVDRNNSSHPGAGESDLKRYAAYAAQAFGKSAPSQERNSALSERDCSRPRRPRGIDQQRRRWSGNGWRWKAPPRTRTTPPCAAGGSSPAAPTAERRGRCRTRSRRTPLRSRHTLFNVSSSRPHRHGWVERPPSADRVR